MKTISISRIRRSILNGLADVAIFGANKAQLDTACKRLGRAICEELGVAVGENVFDTLKTSHVFKSAAVIQAHDDLILVAKGVDLTLIGAVRNA
jgi:catabolite regulation protein CreA